MQYAPYFSFDVRRLNSDIILAYVFIVRGTTLKNYYTKTRKDRDLIFVPFFSYCNVLNRKK